LLSARAQIAAVASQIYSDYNVFIYYYLCRQKMTSAKKKPKQFLEFGRKVIQPPSLFHPQPPSGGSDFVLCFSRKHIFGWI